MNKSFFEHISLSDSEKLHSEFIAWLFSKNCNAITAIQKKSLLKEFLGIEDDIISIHTEIHNIDILILTNTKIIIIENKFKSSQHSNQLEKYEKICRDFYSNYIPKFFYLTLISEDSLSNNWGNISYENLYLNLRKLELTKENSHKYILKEYIFFLERLHVVLRDFYTNTKEFDFVFIDGNKKKHEKKEGNYSTDNQWFIASNQLETILQKSYLFKVFRNVNDSVFYVGETHGSALIDFFIDSNIEYKERLYRTQLQLQGDTLKFIFVIQEKYQLSEKVWVESMITTMDSLSKTNKFGYKKLNKPTTKAFISISKKLEIPYWHLQENEFIQIIKTEIENVKVLSSTLKSLI